MQEAFNSSVDGVSNIAAFDGMSEKQLNRLGLTKTGRAAMRRQRAKGAFAHGISFEQDAQARFESGMHILSMTDWKLDQDNLAPDRDHDYH